MDRQQVITNILSLAKSKLGQKELGNNTGPIVDWSVRHWPRDDKANGWPWCAGFVSTCYLLGGYLPMQQMGSLSCDELWKNSQKFMHCFTKGPITPQPGDIVFFGPEGDLAHVGLVYQIPSPNQLITLEGNHANQVSKVNRPIDSWVSSFARIPLNWNP